MAAGVQHITNHWESTVAPSVLEQYRERTLTDGQAEELGCDNRWQAMLKAVVDQMQIGEDATDELAHILDFNSAPPTGGQLDWVAGLINVTRYPGETDAHFFERFVNDLGRHNAGTPDGTIYSTALLSGDPRPQYFDEADATFFVYTGPKPNKTVSEDSSVVVEQFTDEERKCHGGGNQLLRRQVQQTAPAGVLGLPGAAIQFADGSFMCDAQGRIFLAAADDSSARRELLVVDNNLRPLVTPQGTPIRAVIVGATVPRVEINYNGVPVDAVRIKDLPDAEYDSAYMVRDSDVGGTTKIDESEVGIQMKPSGTNTLKFYRRGPTAESDTEG